MTIESNIQHTSTGEKTPIDVGSPKRLSFITVGTGGTDYVANIEVQLTTDGAFSVAETGIADKTVKVTTGAVKAIRINISSLGSASAVNFEVLGERA